MWTPKGASLIRGPALIRGNTVYKFLWEGGLLACAYKLHTYYFYKIAMF